MSTIMGLLNQIQENEIVLPAIQREFVWSEAQTSKLLDSIMRGYPVGIVLLWETYNDIQFRPFVTDYRSGSLHTYSDNRQKRRIRLVLDGQQRLQSLHIALRGRRDGRELYFDSLSGQQSEDVADDRFLFEFLTKAKAQERNKQVPRRTSTEGTPPRSWWLPITDVLQMDARGRRNFIKKTKQTLDLSDDEELQIDTNLATFDQMFVNDSNIIKASTIDEDRPPEYPFRKSETDVLEIFVRVNTEGTRLSRSDLIFSMLKLSWKESAEGLPEFVASVNQGNSFDLDTDFVVRCLFAVSDLGGRLDLSLLRKRQNVDALQTSFEQCCNAIRATVDFVKRECKCESSDLLGSSHMLVPIVYYLFHLPRHDVPNDQVDRLRSAVYILGLATPFSRYSEGRIGNFVRSELQPRVEASDRTFPLEATIERVRRWEETGTLDDLAQSNVELTLHLIQGLSGGQAQYTRNSPEVDHIFPRAELRKKDVDEDLINDLANFWILAQGKNRNKSNRHPKEYFKDVSDRQLGVALIDRDLLDYRLYKKFITSRREALVQKLESVIGISDTALSG